MNQVWLKFTQVYGQLVKTSVGKTRCGALSYWLVLYFLLIPLLLLRALAEMGIQEPLACGDWAVLVCFCTSKVNLERLSFSDNWAHKLVWILGKESGIGGVLCTFLCKIEHSYVSTFWEWSKPKHFTGLKVSNIHFLEDDSQWCLLYVW